MKRGQKKAWFCVMEITSYFVKHIAFSQIGFSSILKEETINQNKLYIFHPVTLPDLPILTVYAVKGTNPQFFRVIMCYSFLLFMCLSGGFTPLASEAIFRVKTYSQSRRQPTTGTRCPTLFDKWPVHTKAKDIPRPLITQSWATGEKDKVLRLGDIRTTKKTLACVFAGANVLGTEKRDNRLVLLYRWMKLGGNLPPSHHALLFSISGMVSNTDGHTKAFICPVMDYWESQIAPAQGRFEPPTCPSTVEHANHQTMMTAPSRRISYTLGPQRGHKYIRILGAIYIRDGRITKYSRLLLDMSGYLRNNGKHAIYLSIYPSIFSSIYLF